MNPTPAAIKTSLEILSATPHTIASLTAGFTNVQLKSRTDRKSWSANDILAHLRACADVWGNCIEEILEKEHPIIQDIHPQKWIKNTEYLEEDFHTAVTAFTSQREALLKRLQNLTERDWWRAATIVTPSKSREQTVFHYVRRMANHEKVHWIQIKNLVKSL